MTRDCALCLAAIITGTAQLVAGNAVGHHTGGGRQRGYGYVSDPPAGFFVGGSTIEDMNGVYGRIDPAATPEINHQFRWLYKNEEGSGWVFGLAEADPAEAVGGKPSEWLIIDGLGFDRFGHEGETVIPGAGKRWSHLHRGRSSKEDNAVTETGEDDDEELPWQVIYIGDPNMIHRLRHHHRHHKRTIGLALEGAGLADLPEKSAEALDEQAPPEDHPGAHLPAAEEAYEDGDFKKAAGLFSEELDKSTQTDGPSWYHALLHRAKASCHRRLREFQSALDELGAATIFFPHYTMGLLEHAAVFLDQGDPHSAIAPLEQILRLNRNWTGLDQWLVRAKADMHRLDHADPATTAGTAIEGCSNFYTCLHVSIDFTPGELKKAYRKYSKLVHPDRISGSDDAFQLIAKAYNTLNDPEARADYDEGGDIPREQKRYGEEGPSFKEITLRHYFPERFGFEPFGDAHEQRKETAQREWETAPALPNMEGLPNGSYSGSCNGCSLKENGTVLHCTHCKNSQGRRSDSTCSLPCDDGEWPGNIDGNLVCEPIPSPETETESGDLASDPSTDNVHEGDSFGESEPVKDEL